MPRGRCSSGPQRAWAGALPRTTCAVPRPTDRSPRRQKRRPDPPRNPQDQRNGRRSLLAASRMSATRSSSRWLTGRPTPRGWPGHGFSARRPRRRQQRGRAAPQARATCASGRIGSCPHRSRRAGRCRCRACRRRVAEKPDPAGVVARGDGYDLLAPGLNQLAGNGRQRPLTRSTQVGLHLTLVLVAEADGNRTRQRRGTPLTGFEDQGDHQEPRRLRVRLY
jgi:hypothetical protein